MSRTEKYYYTQKSGLCRERRFWKDFSISSIYISSLEEVQVEFVSSIVQSSLEETHFYLNGNLIQEIVIPEDMTSIPNYFLSGFSDVRSIILAT